MNIFKLIWGTAGGKPALAIAAGLFVACLGLSYSVGSLIGYERGHVAGQKSRNSEVKDLTDKVTALTGMVNSKREAEAKKIDKVESDAADAAVETQKQLAKELRARDKIIAEYEARTPPEVKVSCGLSIETVRAINLLIESANNETTSTAYATGSAASLPAAEPQPPLQEGATP